MTAPSNISLFREADPEFVAVVLAATVGSRLFPLTQHGSLLKHLLPLAGVPNIVRLLKCLQSSEFPMIAMVLSQEDTVTVPLLEKEWNQTVTDDDTLLLDGKCRLNLFRVDSDCLGSAHAVRFIHDKLPLASNLVLIPGDAVFLDSLILEQLVHTHRQYFVKASHHVPDSRSLLPSSSSSSPPLAACTVLLGDVGEVDEHGAPLKESAKSKKGGLGREEDEIEYIALSYNDATFSTPPRLVWKQAKLDVEEDKDQTGSTPKFKIPKPRLKTGGGVTRIRLDWNDWHVYIISPWIRELLVQRTTLLSLQSDLIPLLVSRQFRGRRKTFDSSSQLGESMTAPEDDEYSVLAHIDSNKSVFRAHTIPSYMHATKEFIQHASSRSLADQSAGELWLPRDASLQPKGSSLLLTPQIDSKNFKWAVVGRQCTVGARVRLNHVIVADNVTIEDNVILQNTIISAGCVIGENSNLNECQVGPGKVIPPGTKEKGESLARDVDGNMMLGPP